MKLFRLMIVIIIWPSSSFAGFYSGNQIYKGCTGDRTFVQGYVSGAFDKAEFDSDTFAALALSAVSKDPSDLNRFGNVFGAIQEYCTPKSITVSQVSDIFCQYLEKTPQERHLEAPVLLNHALRQAWACNFK